MMKTPSLRKHVRGVAAVEFGLLLIPLVVLLFGITEYGRAIYTYNTLVKSVRNATRYLTTQAPGDSVAQGIAKEMAVCGYQDCDISSPVAPDLTIAMIDVCDSLTACGGVTTSTTTGSGTINLVVVRITGYQYNSVVEYVMPDLTFSNIAVSMRSQL